MTDSQTIPHPIGLDVRGLLLVDLVDENEQLRRENIELRRDCESLRVTLQASCDLNHKYQTENMRLRSHAKQLRASAAPERRAA